MKKKIKNKEQEKDKNDGEEKEKYENLNIFLILQKLKKKVDSISAKTHQKKLEEIFWSICLFFVYI